MESETKVIKRKQNRPFPNHILENALVIANAIQEENAGKPMKKLLVANAIGRKPATTQFRDLLSSSYKYGLTLGTEKAENIELTEIGKQITKPSSSEQELQAKQKAVLIPPKFNEIYSYYNNNKFPSSQFFENVLETQFKIPREYVKEVIDVLEKNGRFVGIIRDISGSPHIMFNDYSQIDKEAVKDKKEPPKEEEPKQEIEKAGEIPKEKEFDSQKKKKVFITHGKNKDLIDPIKKLLHFGELEPIVSTEKQSVSQPVSDKVMNDMRTCDAAIIHIDAEQKLMNKETKEHIILNQNVLIEIGAAMALYGRRFILLVEEGITLPSNLQGLYEVRYKGNNLDGDVTIKLMEAINEMKKVPHPDEKDKE